MPIYLAMDIDAAIGIEIVQMKATARDNGKFSNIHFFSLKIFLRNKLWWQIKTTQKNFVCIWIWYIQPLMHFLYFYTSFLVKIILLAEKVEFFMALLDWSKLDGYVYDVSRLLVCWRRNRLLRSRLLWPGERWCSHCSWLVLQKKSIFAATTMVRNRKSD